MQVESLVGIEHDGELLPVDEVSAAVMSPVLDAAVRVKGAVLIKDVVILAEAAQAVRVVHPADGRHEVKPLPGRVDGDGRAVSLLDPRNQTFQVTMQCVHTEMSSFLSV